MVNNLSETSICRLVDMLRIAKMRHIIAAVVVCVLLIDLLLYGYLVKISSPIKISSPSAISYRDRSLPVPHTGRYLPKWESLDTRPLPQWYDDAKFGIFIVWGVYSVPGFGNEWFWHNWKSGRPDVVKFMNENYPPNFTYADFAASFGAEFFDPDHWVNILKASGARYNATVIFFLVVYIFICLLLVFYCLFIRFCIQTGLAVANYVGHPVL